ncbi:MAG: hypothetical protein PF439_07200 [Helicobacteraceae bacterium]|jgi:ABC-type multidrug transport system fused ATPase/permease subunit|nr:hypothetical protein [Helicobacteraceae bacterium]
MIKKILFSILCLVFIGLSLSETLDTKSSEQLDAALVRSLSTFAVARGLNGLVSIVQGTEVNITPAGVGATFAPGQLLDPVNDMVERFSWVMLMSSVSIGVQEVMLHLGKTTLFKVMFMLITLIFLLQLWLPKSGLPWRVESSFKVVVVLAVLRFSVPMLVMMNEAVYAHVLASEYEQSFTEVSKTSDEVKVMIEEGEIKQAHVEENTSFLDTFNISQKYENYKIELKKSVERFIQKFDDAMESIIRLITVFIINSIILPLAALWLFIYGLGAFLRKDFVLEV